MRPRLQRALAALMTVSLLGAQAPVNVLAESDTEEVAAVQMQAAEETAPETEPPAPATEAPAPETEPPAPVTEAPAPETEAPTPVTEAPAPETEAPAPVTEAPTEPQIVQAAENQQTETPALQSESDTEKESEKKKKEKETEKEKTATAFKTELDGMTVTAQLSRQDALPESTKLVVKALTAESDEKTYEDAAAKVKKLTNQGHRVLSALRLYTVSFMDKKDKTVSVKGDVELTFTSKDGVDLKLGRYLEPGAYTYLIGDTQAEEADKAVLTEKALVESFTFTGKAGDKIALAGIQNRENDGDKVKAAALKKKFAGFDQDSEKAKEKKDSKKSEQTVLDDADAYALTLSNASSSKDVVVVNLYANAEGKINAGPLKAVLDEKEEAIDVSEHSVVVNIVAYTKDQKLTLPQYKVIGKGSDQENAGKVLYNIVTESADGDAETYKGTLTVEDTISGTILAAKATVKLDAEMTGAVYADTLDGDEKQITKAEIGYTDKKDDEAVTEETMEAVSEADEAVEPATEDEAPAEALKADDQVQAPQIDWTASLGVTAVDEADTEEAKQALNDFAYELVYPSSTEEAPDDVVLLSAETTDGKAEFALNLDDTPDEEQKKAVYEKVKAALANGEEVAFKVKQTKAADGYVLADSETETKDVTLKLVEDSAQPDTNPDEESSDEDVPGDAQADQTVAQKLVFTADGDEEVNSLIFANKFTGARLTVKVIDAKQAGDVNAVSLVGTKLMVTGKLTDGTEAAVAEGEITQADVQSGKQLVLDEKKIREALALTKDTETEADPLESGVELTVTQTPSEGYMPNDEQLDLSRTIKVNLDAQTGMLHIDPGMPITLVNKKAPQVERSVAVSIDSVLQGTSTQIQGITYQLRDDQDSVVPDTQLTTGLLSTAPAAWNGAVTLSDEQMERLQAAENKTVTWTLEAMSYPGYDLVSAKTQTVTLKLDESGDTTKVSAEPASVKFEYAQQAQITQDKIRVTKFNYHNNSGIFFTNARTYYVALYDVNGSRVSTIRSITIPKGQSSAYTEFAGLKPGTYTIHEVTQNGEIVPENTPNAAEAFYATYEVEGQAGQNVTVNGTVPSGQTYNATIRNNYLAAPEGTSYYAAFRVQKTYVDEKNAAKKVTGNFYFKVYDAKTNKALSNSAYAIALNNASSGSSKRIRMKMTAANAERQLKIIETDSKGKALVSGEHYDITYENQTFTLTPSQKEEEKITIKNAEVAKKTEAEGPATLTLTKKVTYKGSPIRVNAVYYIGIFDDAGLSKLRYKKAMRFNNASEVSSPLTIHIEKLKDKAVTFYFAEVDAKGKVVSGGKSTGYDISQNKKSITLNADNLKDELVITNDVLPGTKTEKALTTPGSTFAGDSAALAEAQSLEADANAGAKTTTGDDSPIIPLTIALVLSAGVLSALGIMIRKRRK